MSYYPRVNLLAQLPRPARYNTRMDEKHGRRWFRFSLRTLFLVITAVSLWLGWNYRIVHERKEIRRQILQDMDARKCLVRTSWWPDEPPQFSWTRTLLGDEPWFSGFFLSKRHYSEQDVELIHLAYPECEIHLGHKWYERSPGLLYE